MGPVTAEEVNVMTRPSFDLVLVCGFEVLRMRKLMTLRFGYGGQVECYT